MSSIKEIIIKWLGINLPQPCEYEFQIERKKDKNI